MWCLRSLSADVPFKRFSKNDKEGGRKEGRKALYIYIHMYVCLCKKKHLNSIMSFDLCLFEIRILQFEAMNFRFKSADPDTRMGLSIAMCTLNQHFPELEA